MEIIMKSSKVAIPIAKFNCWLAFHNLHTFIDMVHKCSENDVEILKCFLKVEKENCIFPLATVPFALQ